MTDSNSKQLELRFDSSIYSDLAIQKAAHKYSDHFSIKISLDSDSSDFICIVSPTATGSIEAFCSTDFENDVYDHQLRLKLADATEPIRNLIIAQAFSKTNLISPDND